MKKRILILLTLILLTTLLLTFSACTAQVEEAEETAAEEPAADRTQSSDYVFIAYITDGGAVDDAALNHNCWAAVEDFANVYSFDHAYYKPQSTDAADLKAACEEAITDGASTLVCSGAVFTETVSKLAAQHPELRFLLVDVDPAVGTLPNNVCALHYREEEAGFLAGYAAVSEGLLKLGIMGGAKTDGELRYSYGFIQGADYAAGVLTKEVSIRCAFSGSPDPSETVSTTCAHWYEDGVQAVFCVGGNLYRSTVQAAEAAAGRWVIACDVDRSEISKTVLSSARKAYYGATGKALLELLENEWSWSAEQAGQVVSLGLAESALNLPTEGELWRFQTFKVDKYKELVGKMIPTAVEEKDEDKDDSKDSADGADNADGADSEDGAETAEVKAPEITVSDNIASPPETAHAAVEYLK